MHAERENVLLPRLSALANEGKETHKRSNLKRSKE